MTGSEFISEIPAVAGQEREDAILQAVKDGGSIVCFTPLEIEEGGHSLRIDVAMDAVRIGEHGDSVRVAATAITQQGIADHLGCLLPTAKICDLIWKRVLGGSGIKLTPHTQTPDSHMADTSRFVEHSEAIDKERDGRCGLLWPVGKAFVLSEKVTTGKCANYGWHVTSGSKFAGVTEGVRVLQPLATAHSDTFTDYSQLCSGLVKRRCYLDGEEADLADVLKDPALCALVSTEGPLDAFMYQRAAEPAEPSERPRTTVPGEKGPEVVAWQEFLISYFEDRGIEALPRYGADGDHGGETEEYTQSWRSDSGQLTVIQAANYRPANRTDVRWVMMHTMEAVEKPDTAEGVARWFAGQSGAPPETSSHYCVDSDSIVLCVNETDIAWACKGANGYSVHYELAGYAKQSADDWSDSFSQAMLQRAAAQAAVTAARWGIPIKKIGADEMRAGAKGFVGHVDGSDAFKKSTHYDPGPNFPWEDFLSMVRAV